MNKMTTALSLLSPPSHMTERICAGPGAGTPDEGPGSHPAHRRLPAPLVQSIAQRKVAPPPQSALAPGLSLPAVYTAEPAGAFHKRSTGTIQQQ